MPNAITGLTGTEIITYIKNFTGNQSSEFETFLTTLLPLAEYRWSKAHDWACYNKQNLSLTVATGTAEYTLSAANLGHLMRASNVKSIFSVANNRYLHKVSLDQIRRMDPDQNDGTTGAGITHWAPVGDNTIVVYPQTFSDTTLKVDGRITPAALLTLSNPPSMPFEYQDAFIQWVLGVALERENDDRAARIKQEAAALIRQDIQADMANLGDTTEPRIRSVNELMRVLEHGTADPLNMQG